MAAPSSFRYFLREALRDLWDRRVASTLSIAAIAASLTLTGLIVTIARGASSTLERWRSELGMSVFLGENTTEEQRAAIRQALQERPETASLEFVGREQAAERFAREFPDLGDLPGLLSENPFPASFEVTLHPETATAEGTAAVAGAIRALPGVSAVRYDSGWFERVRGLLRAAGAGGALLGVILLGAAVVTISSVVRLGLAARQDEIEILRLVGAEPGFIRAPFLIQGALQGVAGGAAAVILIAATFVLLVRGGAGDPAVADFAGALRPLFGPLEALALVSAGAMLGLSGSVVAGARSGA